MFLKYAQDVLYKKHKKNLNFETVSLCRKTQKRRSFGHRLSAYTQNNQRGEPLATSKIFVKSLTMPQTVKPNL